MAGHIALVGGDEFRAGCEEMDRAVLEATGRDRPSVLVIPTAAAEQSPSKAAANGVGYFSGLGADASALMVLDATEAADAELLAPADSADVLYLTGGSPRHLLSVLEGSLLLRKLEDALARGATVAGSSAGAMVLGSWMRFRDWTEALGIVPGAVLPHHERSDPFTVAKQLAAEMPSGVYVLGIDSMTCCSGGSDGWRVLGQGAVTLYINGAWHKFGSGEQVDILVPGSLASSDV